jgi:hypothetical protein
VTRFATLSSVRPVSAGRTAFYRLPVDTPESAREAEARARADQRLRRQRDILRPLGFVVIAAVTIGAINGHPAPAAHGKGLGIAAALVVFAVSVALAASGSFVARSLAVQTSVVAAMGVAGVALVALQPRGHANDDDHETPSASRHPGMTPTRPRDRHRIASPDASPLPSAALSRLPPD